MGWMSRHWTFVLVLLVFYVLYIGSAALGAYLEFRARPREPMEWCSKHGMFRRKHVLPFMGTSMCPMCYQEAWNHAEHGGTR